MSGKRFDSKGNDTKGRISILCRFFAMIGFQILAKSIQHPETSLTSVFIVLLDCLTETFVLGKTSQKRAFAGLC